MTVLSIPKSATGTRQCHKALKIVFIAMTLAAEALFSPALCLAKAFEAGPGMGGPRFHHEIIKIGPAPRAELRIYLSREYQRQCTAVKKPPAICANTKPLYAGSGLPVDGTRPLPPDVLKRLGFVQPGTDYVQRGFVVYLIALPRRIILDNVTASEEFSDIQWSAP